MRLGIAKRRIDGAVAMFSGSGAAALRSRLELVTAATVVPLSLWAAARDPNPGSLALRPPQVAERNAVGSVPDWF